MALQFFWLLLSASILLAIVLCLLHSGVVRRQPLPPGPKGHWFFGVKKQLPRKEPWKTYVSWSQLYNEPIVSCRVYNRTLIILNNAQSILDLLERRANIYSDRPEQYMSHVVCGRSKTVFNISSQEPRHKAYRKLVQQGLGPKSTKAYWPLLQEELTNLLDGLEQTPQKYVQHIRRNSVGVIMRVAFGYTITDLDDTFVGIADETTKITEMTMANGSWLVDYYPIARYIPSFLPGGKFKQMGKVWKERLSYLSEVPHQWVRQQMASGTYSESFTSSLLNKNGKPVDAEQEDIVRWCAGGLYVGAADTTVSAITSFILLMALYPTIQSRIQSEIDEICGLDQTPHPSQLGQLTYLHAVLKEVLRYAPVGNLALPHKVIQDDEYRGYRIPKNSTVIGNVWAVLHDPTIFPDPETFSPERFLSSPSCNKQKPQPDPRQWAFGFGRRACPGTHFAETSMLYTMAGILSAYNISLPLAAAAFNAKTARPNISFTTGMTSHIEPFDISITRRNRSKPRSI